MEIPISVGISSDTLKAWVLRGRLPPHPVHLSNSEVAVRIEKWQEVPVQLVQQVCSCLYATLGKAEVLVTNILHGYSGLLHSKLGGFPQAGYCVLRLLSCGLELNMIKHILAGLTCG